jgi:hypothetical protein
LPLLVCACSSDDPPALGTAGTGGSAGNAGAAGAGGAAGTGGTGGANGGASGASTSGAGGGMPGGSSGSGGAPIDAGTDASDPGGGDLLDDGTMTFFVTSDGIGNGGNLGGLAGADAFCRQLATAVSADFGRRTWRAYLSTTTENAGERIGTGPWRNQAGVIIANDLTQLHDQGETGSLNDTWDIGDLNIPLDEQGATVANNVHDILTGSQADGTLDPGLTCDDWTSNDAADSVRVGHSNRMGGGQDPSWTTTHTVGCNQEGAGNITQLGGRGSLYCFALIIER